MARPRALHHRRPHCVRAKTIVPPWLHFIVREAGEAGEAGMTGCAKLIWSCPSRTLALIISLCSVASGPVLATDGDGAAIEGRWQTAKKDLVLDISRCAQGYCGQLVTADNPCDRTIMTVAVRTTSPRPFQPEFDGDFAPPKGLRPSYKVRVSVMTAAGEKPATMVIIGDEVDPNPMRRSFPYRAVLARLGEATCQPRTTS